MGIKNNVLTVGISLLSVGVTSAASLVGLWEFDDASDLGKATVGTDLNIAGTAPSHSASMADSTTNSLNGVVTNVSGNSNYFDATHGIGANGGGALTNQYTLIFDVKRPAGAEWRAFYQTTLANNNDAEYFTRGGGGVVNSLGRGTIGYSATAMAEDTWIRLAISVDLEAGSYVSYVDGALFRTHTAPAVDSGYAMDTDRVLLFADNDGENSSMDVGSVAIYDGALNSSEVLALGGAGSAIAIPEPSSAMLFGLGGIALMLRRKKN